MENSNEIKKLDETVINRIAAGEVIQRPANALKEMIENSLDAKSTNIQVLVKNGGLKLLQIQDNGIGIRKDDFEIVCERFTTSKLRNFEDLQNINTYGFRGEALASISHVAHLTIQSKTRDQICAYKANFIDGKLQSNPVPIAGNQGTIIIVEDLFYNMNVRQKALHSPAEEYQKISDVVGKYSIHNAKVGFALKKYGENSNDIKTQIDSNCVDNIRTIYGNQIAKELIEFSTENMALNFKANGFMTNVNYSAKKFHFLLFINHRLVDCQNLKKNISQVYSTYLPKNTHPFVYLSLELKPSNVDVNVHPTKHEVHFLNEEQIIDAICSGIEKKLLGSNNSRVFYTQAKLPNVDIIEETATTLKITNEPKIAPKEMIRTDFGEQKLEKFFGAATVDKDSSLNVGRKSLCKAVKSKLNRVETQLTSVLQLRKEVETNCHRNLRELFAKHVFVGSIDPNQVLIQYSTKLYLCNTKKIFYELIYQFVLYNFQNFDSIKFEKPFPLFELALLGLGLPEVGWTPEDGDKEELAEKIVQILKEKSAMLSEYFAIEIDEEGNLCGIPLLLDNYYPDITGLPLYIVRLATDVDWESEKECFDTFAKETAMFYCEITENTCCDNNDWKWVIEHVVYPAIKDFFIPPKKFTDNVAILEIANLPNLYKVFERC